MPYLDLDELPVSTQSRCGRPPAAPAASAAPTISATRGPLATVRALSPSAGAGPEGPVRLSPRRARSARFNPVSFYYCFDAAEGDAVIAEVTNTPWGERHCYVVARRRGRARQASRRPSTSRRSCPWTTLRRWRLTRRGATLRVTIAPTATGAGCSTRR